MVIRDKLISVHFDVLRVTKYLKLMIHTVPRHMATILSHSCFNFTPGLSSVKSTFGATGTPCQHALDSAHHPRSVVSRPENTKDQSPATAYPIIPCLILSRSSESYLQLKAMCLCNLNQRSATGCATEVGLCR